MNSLFILIPLTLKLDKVLGNWCWNNLEDELEEPEMIKWFQGGSPISQN